jgi:hypothetical protein
MSPTQRNLTKPQLSYHPLGVFLNLGQTLTCKASDTQASSSEPNETLALIHRAITMACEKLAETDWVHSLPFQPSLVLSVPVPVSAAGPAVLFTLNPPAVLVEAPLAEQLAIAVVPASALSLNFTPIAGV